MTAYSLKGWLLYVSVAGVFGVLGWVTLSTGPFTSLVLLSLFIAAYIYALNRIYARLKVLDYPVVAADPRLSWVPSYFRTSPERLLGFAALNMTCAAAIMLALTIIALYVV